MKTITHADAQLVEATYTDAVRGTTDATSIARGASWVRSNAPGESTWTRATARRQGQSRQLRNGAVVDGS